MPYSPQAAFNRIYGEDYGYSPERQRELFLQGTEDINQQYDILQRQKTTGLADRGFYSARPMQRMVGQNIAKRTRAYTQYRQGIQSESEALADKQRSMVFGAEHQAGMQEDQQAHARMLQQLGFTNQEKMAKLEYDYQRDLMLYGKELAEKKWWEHALGLVGQVGGAFAGGIGSGLVGGGGGD